ncbi:hypothetical protein AMJ80_01790 [bacterium SM23_31]|nr:MAG: hypothetical protein AMJ80_01790 [bacterium SM23_31]
MNKELLITVKNDISEIARLSKIIEQFGENNNLSLKIIFDLNLALEEFLTNVIKYSYGDDREHLISINISLVEDEIITVIEDDGNIFNPLEISKPDIKKPPEERKIGGLGIHLVRNLFDQLKYERKNNKNIISFIKKVS